MMNVASQLKTAIMEKNQILRANLLDILFDGRNKGYGAYVLRREYNQRLWLAVLIVFLLVGGLVFALLLNKPVESPTVFRPSPGGHILKEYFIPPPQPPPQISVRSRPTAGIITPQIQIRPDDQVRNRFPDLANSSHDTGPVSDIGRSATGPVDQSVSNSLPDNNNITGSPGNTDFRPQEQKPEFPGGEEALMRFLKNHLITPDGLQTGEKKSVLVRFWVGTDGLVSQIEVMQSGGPAFDREVLRVCRRMPRWQPALQNGMPLAVSYILPVTFVGVEE